MSDRVILCESEGECSCGAPAANPAFMHHKHCPVNPAEPDGSGCRVCRLREPEPMTECLPDEMDGVVR